jgi:DNA (cytosine-5)-methyltransferase 1
MEPTARSNTARPTAVSLFTGAGGLDVGIEQAGFAVVSATDLDADCVATMTANQAARIPIPGQPGRTYLDTTRLLCSPVEGLTADDLRPPDADDDWHPDLLIGGPPCQPFSSAGKMLSVHDPRGRLFEDFVRLAKSLAPRVILFENVSGLVTARGPHGRPGEALMLVKEQFEAAGYSTSFGLLNSADFGVPQRRVRCFMFGSRLHPLPEFPEATHAENPVLSLLGPSQQRWQTLGEFLRSRPGPADEVVRPSPELRRKLASVSSGSGLKSRGVREATRPGGHWGYKQGTWIADLNRPARTVTAAATQDWIREEDGSLRRLTLSECAQLQGFPDGWVFVGTKASRFRQVGNAVPSVFGVILGRALMVSLEAQHGQTRRAKSAPLPARFHAAIRYTQREHARNGPSRDLARVRAAAGVSAEVLKGLGSEEIGDGYTDRVAYASSL